MKRTFNFFDALVIMFLYGLLEQSGFKYNWLAVFAPFVVELVLRVFEAADKVLGFSSKVRFKLLKPLALWKYRKELDKATAAQKEFKKQAAAEVDKIISERIKARN